MKTEKNEAETVGAVNESFGGLLDRVLRDREPLFDELFEGRNLGRNLRWFCLTIMVLSGFYGLTMGLAGLVSNIGNGLLQMVSSAIKVPVLYLLSVAVCYPVLFIVVVLMGSKLHFTQTLGLILLALTLNSILLASCAPIVLFFFFTGASYHFLKVLHVAIMAFSGCWAMLALWQGLQAVCEKSALYPKRAIRILQVWMLVFGFVGTQMAWSLRPFVGSPDLGFEWLRMNQDGNFYEAVWYSVRQLGSGNRE
ncbi:MAG: hypothetical protein K9N62_01830 [Verrucomicrobia bacterium]|nr:hypothetical protein [Verrucomicrobiota bacterium]